GVIYLLAKIDKVQLEGETIKANVYKRDRENLKQKNLLERFLGYLMGNLVIINLRKLLELKFSWGKRNLSLLFLIYNQQSIKPSSSITSIIIE
ncbi:hypothetical protein ZYGR_0AG04020, partial [Zygosaccharomyces rouxii]